MLCCHNFIVPESVTIENPIGRQHGDSLIRSDGVALVKRVRDPTCCVTQSLTIFIALGMN
jgi:hypothetical protein